MKKELTEKQKDFLKMFARLIEKDIKNKKLELPKESRKRKISKNK